MLEALNTKIKERILHSSYSVNKFKSKTIIKLKERITSGIIISIRHRKKWFTKLKFKPFGTQLKKFYNSYRNLPNILIKKSKQFYYQNKLIKAQSDSKQVWNIINEVIGKSNKNKICNINKMTNKEGLITESKTNICNELNDFFINVGNNL